MNILWLQKWAYFIDHCLTSATDSNSALTQQPTELFSRGGFVLRKWNSNDPSVLEKSQKISEILTKCRPFMKAPSISRHSESNGMSSLVSFAFVLQLPWELKLNRVDPVRHCLTTSLKSGQWRRELLALTTVHIP